jgi:transposase
MLNPGRAWRKREDQTVARKTYSEEFRRDAVELYRTTPGATVVGIAADLGIMDGTLRFSHQDSGLSRRGQTAPLVRAAAGGQRLRSRLRGANSRRLQSALG